MTPCMYIEVSIAFIGFENVFLLLVISLFHFEKKYLLLISFSYTVAFFLFRLNMYLKIFSSSSLLIFICYNVASVLILHAIISDIVAL